MQRSYINLMDELSDWSIGEALVALNQTPSPLNVSVLCLTPTPNAFPLGNCGLILLFLSELGLQMLVSGRTSFSLPN